MGAESPGAVSEPAWSFVLMSRAKTAPKLSAPSHFPGIYSANLLGRKGTWDINKTKGKGREPGPGRQLLDRIDLWDCREDVTRGETGSWVELNSMNFGFRRPCYIGFSHARQLCIGSVLWESSIGVEKIVGMVKEAFEMSLLITDCWTKWVPEVLWWTSYQIRIRTYMKHVPLKPHWRGYRSATKHRYCSFNP